MVFNFDCLNANYILFAKRVNTSFIFLNDGFVSLCIFCILYVGALLMQWLLSTSAHILEMSNIRNIRNKYKVQLELYDYV